jgi:hypothetical protein
MGAERKEAALTEARQAIDRHAATAAPVPLAA